jgi:hypothetical protein
VGPTSYYSVARLTHFPPPRHGKDVVLGRAIGRDARARHDAVAGIQFTIGSEVAAPHW